MAEFHFEVSGETVAVIEELQVQLGARSPAHVFRKALALAKLFADAATDGVVVLYGADPDNAISIDLRN